MVGDSGVGKTSLLHKYRTEITRFVDLDAGSELKPTLGIEYRSKIVSVPFENKLVKVKVKIWDTAGQERYKSVTSV
jgi:GTPase SAR1 family protein